MFDVRVMASIAGAGVGRPTQSSWALTSGDGSPKTCVARDGAWPTAASRGLAVSKCNPSSPANSGYPVIACGSGVLDTILIKLVIVVHEQVGIEISH